MQGITPKRPWPLFDVAATRHVEQTASASLPPHSLMQRAGLAVARLALAVAPHARTIWIACGPGNNGGDGLEAAMHLQQWGKEAVVTWLGDEATAPADAVASLGRARAAGVTFAAEPPAGWQLAIDAMLGIGSTRPLEGKMADWASSMGQAGNPVLSIDLPSGLHADTGKGAAVQATHTLCLLTLKPGLFTGGGRDACGAVWFDDLDVGTPQQPNAWLAGPPARSERPHASHKGSYGDVAVVGGAPGMTGAALLAASAALHGGAGRVLVALLDGGAMAVDAAQPELMFRHWDSLDLSTLHLACGCGGGDAVRAVLPKAISKARSLVLDADALNALATDTQLQTQLQARARRGDRPTVLTPHPLEAARLLVCATAQVQSDRLAAAQALVQRFGCTVVLKGSGTVIACPGEATVVNPTGNARLATAGTGDVLAGLIAARLAAGAAESVAATGAAYDHGQAADRWPAERALTASELARRC
ncbi:MAG: NAD(P)H-hydrate dehydratase [Comamonadaceae bacterium]|nr:MAG: NAD(P)H-hydrate dehydratase [Comamonadaceae bacterium]